MPVSFRHARCGQALIESCLIMGLVCLLLMGIFQLAQLFVAREIIDFSAGRGARARTVGFNEFMVLKTLRIASIPNAGAMIFPGYRSGGPLEQYIHAEMPRIPHYLQAEARQLGSILDYSNWSSIGLRSRFHSDDIIRFEAYQEMPILFFPNLFKAFYADSAVPLNGTADIEAHYPLYLE